MEFCSSINEKSKVFNRYERYEMLNEQYNERIRYEPHKSIPIKKLKIKTNRKDDFIYELIYKHEKKRDISLLDDENKTIKMGEINQEISDYLQDVFIRSIWMINRSIGRSDTIYIESSNYTVRESLNEFLGDIIDFKNDDEDYYTIIDIFMNKIYRINEDIMQIIIEKYHTPRYRSFIYHINLYIKTNLVE